MICVDYHSLFDACELARDNDACDPDRLFLMPVPHVDGRWDPLEAIVLTPETELFNDFAWVAIPPYRPFKDQQVEVFDPVKSVGYLLTGSSMLLWSNIFRFFADFGNFISCDRV